MVYAIRRGFTAVGKRAAILAGALFLTLTADGATTYSLSGDFSSSSNPDGVWTYGWLNALGGSFTTYSQAVTYTGTAMNISAWDDPNHVSAYVPAVFNNPGAAPSAFINAANILPGGWAGFHPGASDEISDFRFTAPATGQYALSFNFQGADTVGATTTVYLYTAGSQIFGANVNGYGSTSLQSFSGTVSLAAGQQLDIGVGYGTNGNYLYDLTAVQGTITAVPEPGSLPLIMAGCTFLSVLGLHRRLLVAARR